MPKAKLDATFCLTATCEPGKRRTDWWCTHLSGFVLECRSTGGKTYYLRYHDSGGRQRQHKIGGYSDITFDQARKAAKRLRSKVVLGGDPVGEKQIQKAIPTYIELAAQHADHAESYQKSAWSAVGILQNHIVPRWGKYRLSEIKPQDIAKWLREKADQGLKPATIEKIRVVFGRSFELARQWEIPGAEPNPLRRVPRVKFCNARDRYLTAEETARLLQAVAESTNPQLKHIVGLLLLTGARVSELLHAQWRHINLERRLWLIPISKNGKARHVPLSEAAVGVIERLPRFSGCPHLIPNPETLRPFVSIKRAWQTARRQAGLSDVHIHDLRHTFASNLVNAGVDLYAVGKVLGHTNVASSQRYSHLSGDTLLAAVEAGAANLKGGWSDHYSV